MDKIYVFDTSVLIHDPMSLFHFGESKVVIPAIVLEELDRLKTDSERLRGVAAQEVLKAIDKLTAEFPDLVTSGIPLENGGELVVEQNHISFDKIKNVFNKDTADNRIIAVAKNYTDELAHAGGTKKVVLVSNDIGLRTKARVVGVLAEGYHSDRLVSNVNEVYSGVEEVYVDPELFSLFYKGSEIDVQRLGFVEFPIVNTFIKMRNEFDDNQVAVGRVVRSNKSGRLVVRKLLVDRSTSTYGIQPKDLNQQMLMDVLLDDSIHFISVIGKAGTGKTLLSLAAGLHQVQDTNQYKRVLAMRAMVVVGKKEIGFLPGDMEEKLMPYMLPFYDNLEVLFDARNKDLELEDILAGMEKDFRIESTGFMRGRSLPKQFIIVDEAQNLTKHEVKTLVTRAGEGAKIILLGDPSQIDDPYLDSVNNGLVYATEKLKDSDITATITLTGRSKRSDLAELASNNL